MKRKARRWRMWAGYTDGDPDIFSPSISMSGCVLYGAILPSRKLAIMAYEDVRPVEVREILPKRRKKWAHV